MYHFFVEPSQRQAEQITVLGSDVWHIRNVLRMKPGEQVEISDGTGMRYFCVLEEVKSDCVIFRVQDTWAEDRELPVRIVLFQGIPKGDKMELILQKAVELGVYEIVPVVTRRTIVKLDDRKAEKKRERWNAISKAAAKQSGRSLVPNVHEMLSFSEALDYAGNLDGILIPYEKAGDMQESARRIEEKLEGKSVGIFIGPEGGFEEEEVALAREAGAAAITLGRRILRTETAGLAILSVLMYHLELKSG